MPIGRPASKGGGGGGGAPTKSAGGGGGVEKDAGRKQGPGGFRRGAPRVRVALREAFSLKQSACLVP